VYSTDKNSQKNVMKVMNKILITICVLTLTGCAEKNEFEQAVLEQMKKDKDVIDYKITPETMVECVSSTITKNMPGVFALDPERRTAYANYAKILKLNESTDPKKTMDELRQLFGSPKALADAHANYGESVVECMAGLVTNGENPMSGH
jgi:hypothetical protein